MTSPLAAKATFNRHAACEMGKKQKQFFCRNVTSSVLQYLSPCPAPIPFCFWVTLAMHHGLLPHHPQPTSPSGAPDLAFPIHSPDRMLTLRVEIQLVRCAWLCWEEPWAWRGTWHTPAAPQGCSRKEALSPYKHHEQGTCPTCQCRWQAHVAVSAAPCAAGGEIWEVLGHCCEAARRLSVLLLGQWHQAKAEPMHKHLVQSGVVCICILWYFPDSPSIALSAGMPLELDLSACRRVRVFCTHFSLM